MRQLWRWVGAAVLGAVLLTAVPVSAEPWPVRSLSIFARVAAGATKTGPFTEVAKNVGFGTYVTWRFATDPTLQWSSLVVERAQKGADGAWGPFRAVTSVIVDDTGVAYYAMTSNQPLNISIRALYPAHNSVTTADSRSPARQAAWMSSPPRPLVLSIGTAAGPSTTFSTTTKVAALGQTVTWRFVGPPESAGQWASVWIADRGPGGLWGPFMPNRASPIQFDAQGIAVYHARYTDPAWISVRIYLPAGSPPVPETWSGALQARWR